MEIVKGLIVIVGFVCIFAFTAYDVLHKPK